MSDGGFTGERIVMEEMTWSEIQAALKRGYDRAVLVAGSVEQHGPHLPLITDTAIGYALAERVARKLGRALVAPVIRPGCSDHHMAFAGSFTIPEPLLKALIEAHVASLAHHGFRTLILLASHGGNFAAVARLESELNARFAPQGVKCLSVADLDGFIQAQNRPLLARGVSEAAAGSHAGLAETSEMLAIQPDLVRRDRFEPGFTGEVRPEEVIGKGLRAFTPNGILGDPTPGSDATLGVLVLEAIADHIVNEVRRRLEP